jgi:pyruvate formate lyase activating enzyme
MKIGGFQKFSLLEFPGQLAAIVFTQGCNFRCPYCHNPELVDPEKYSKQLPTQRVLDFLRHRKGKLGAVVITGGEPTFQADLVDFVRDLKELGYMIKMDTNGSYPDVVASLAEQKLVDYWAMDIKAPEALYPVVTKCNIPMQNIKQSMQILRDSGQGYEFRTTFFERLFSWNDIASIQELLRSGDKFYLQECRYTDTLEDLSNAGALSGALEASGFTHLQDNPACKTLIRWGERHQVIIRIRSL